MGGAGGGDKRVSDTVGEGARDYDPGTKPLITPEARMRARCSVLDMLAKPGSMKSASASASAATPTSTLLPSAAGSGQQQGMPMTAEERLTAQREAEDEKAAEAKGSRSRGIFDGVVVYVNGSTHPLISDHRLRHVLAEHGGMMSSHLGRRKVTHVILGRHSSSGYGSGCGGGLAGAKLQKEILKIGGPGVKYVGVEWVLESIKAGKRLPEARFADLKIAAKNQQSVYGLYSKHANAKEKTSVSTTTTTTTTTNTNGEDGNGDEDWDWSQLPPSGQRA